MCLIIVGASREVRETLLDHPDVMRDIYLSNADGLGAMYPTTRGLRTIRTLPKNAQDFAQVIRALPTDDRVVALHARMATHGSHTLENCHPYDVITGRVALMHNGVLATGNAEDKTKSDTWHYVRKTVAPMLLKAPKLFMNEGWQELVARDITGANRFVVMNDRGDYTILNEDTGIYHNGIWFANEYAWDPSLLIPGYISPYMPTRSRWVDGWDYTGHEGAGISAGTHAKSATDTTGYEDADDYFEDDIYNAVDKLDDGWLVELIDHAPLRAIQTLLWDFRWERDRAATIGVPMAIREEISTAYETEDIRTLLDYDSRDLARVYIDGGSAALIVE